MTVRFRWLWWVGAGAVLSFLPLLVTPTAAGKRPIELLNASYDPTREFYLEFNDAFRNHWKALTGMEIFVRQSHGGSSKQARSVIDGLNADVVTLALAYDIDALHEHGRLLPKNWQDRLPHSSSPYTSVIVFLVRQGNPKNIRDWDDLIRPGISVITPNPKTSGGARWNYLAAYGYALEKANGDESMAREFIRKLFQNVPLLDSGARGATITFLQRGIGDVLIAWENEALLAAHQLACGKVEIVMPSVTILAEPPVALVDKVVDRKGSRAAAQAYLDYLYSEAGQEIAARHYFRPRSKEVERRYAAQFRPVRTFRVDEIFEGWQRAHAVHFRRGGVFDQTYRGRAR